MPHITKLPTEVLDKIADNVPLDNFFDFAGTCKRFLEVSNPNLKTHKRW